MHIQSSLSSWCPQSVCRNSMYMHTTVSCVTLWSRYAVRKNLVLDSVSDAVAELKLFREAGGGAVCDVTTVGIRCKPEALPQISRESGVHIVMGTGYYVGSYLPEEVKLMTSQEVRGD